jgi:penicillin-binding protein 1A
MNQLLSCVTESGTASKVTLKNTVDTAGKTGTSGDDKDRVFIGYTPYITAGIWCGYRDSDTSIGKVFPTHIKIWDDIMSDIHSYLLQNKSDSDIAAFSKKGLIKRDYCMDSGKLFTDICAYDPRGQRIESGYFIKGSEPTKFCDRHVLVDYDTEYGGLADDECENTEKVALIYAERSFPMQIYVTDAEYVWRDIGSTVPPNTSEHQPFYANLLAENEYCGISRSEKQFNRYCKRHFSYYAWKEKKDE